MVRPVGIDLFAGAGGLSLGFEQAGFEVAAAVEIDPVHAAVHQFNFPHCVVIPRSVVGLTGAEIRKIAGLEKSRIDMVFGGAPCQGFSMIGQRALDDPRNVLVKEFVRLVHELDASYFMFENVKGLTVGRHRDFLRELIEAFEDAGYSLRTPWQVLNATSYQVPQDRHRLILMGAKKGLALPQYPLPLTHAAGSTELATPVGPTCREALGDLPEAEDFPALFRRDSVATTIWGEPSIYAQRMRCVDDSVWELAYQRCWDPALLTSSMRTRHTEISRRRFGETEPGTIEPISRLYRLPPDGVSNTLRAGTDSARGAFTSPRPIHYEKARCVTVREMARLHGFPDWFRFHATKWHGARQIGNSVPPPMARAIGVEFLKVLGNRVVRPKKRLELSDPKLLTLSLAQAADHWGVPNPIGRRDRRSGAKKRRQVDIEAERLARRSASG